MDGLGERVEGVAPGVELAEILASVDQSQADGWDLVRLLQGWWRQASHAQARAYALMVKVAQAVEAEIGFEFAPDEIAAALCWTRKGGASQLHLAYQLIERFPQVWMALESGEIDLAKAKVIVYGLEGVEDGLAQQVADRLMVGAAERTTGQISASLRRYLMQVDPQAAQGRYENGVTHRRVELGANSDGTANLYGLCLPAERASAAMASIDFFARQVHDADDPRTLDQVRADVLLDLLEGKTVTARAAGRGTVDLVVDLTTLARLSENPAEIAGFGPVVADVARKVAAEQPNAEWRYTVTDPQSGQVVANGTTRRRPTTALRRWVQSRHRTCRWPGCRRPALNCDLDHRQPWSMGGKTSTDNLFPLCRRHHRAKDVGGWKLDVAPDGTFIWTSPLGLTYAVQPEGP